MVYVPGPRGGHRLPIVAGGAHASSEDVWRSPSSPFSSPPARRPRPEADRHGKTLSLSGLERLTVGADPVTFEIRRENATTERVPLLLRLDTEHEISYPRHGGTLPLRGPANAPKVINRSVTPTAEAGAVLATIRQLAIVATAAILRYPPR